MRKNYVAILMTLIVLAAASVSPAAAGVKQTHKSPPPAAPMMPLSEVKPGQIGKVYTVFQGTTIEEFECEVIGILQNSIGPHKHMIMVKLRGEKPEFTGVVAGMSGSPVYIDGKLVGALAYRWGVFAKEAIGGITPIRDILEVAGFEKSTPDRRGSGQGAGISTIAGMPSAPAVIGRSITDPTTSLAMSPISTPLVFSGFHRRVFEEFAGLMQQDRALSALMANVIPVMGGGAPSNEVKQDSKLEPGAAIACVLMKGDMSIAATGTLTFVDGKRLFAFGHPMFQTGAIDIPMAKADVALTFSSSMASSKVAQPTEIVGAVRQDRLTAIMGEIGTAARMIPVSVEVRTATGDDRKYNFEIFEEALLTPLLLNLAVSNTLMAATYNEAIQTVSIAGKIDVEGHQPVMISDVMASDDMDLASPLGGRVALNLTRAFSTLFNNPIQRPSIKAVTLRLEQTRERRGVVIEEVRADREEVKPGEEFSLAVLLRPYRSERITKVLKLKVPETAERGQELRVMVSDAMGIEIAEGRNPRQPGAQATSLSELIGQLNRARPNTAVYVRLSQETPGAVINNRMLPSLPLSVLSVIKSNQTANNTTSAADSTLSINTEPLGEPVIGRKSVILIVK